jgi:hypothetical protein
MQLTSINKKTDKDDRPISRLPAGRSRRESQEVPGQFGRGAGMSNWASPLIMQPAGWQPSSTSVPTQPQVVDSSPFFHRVAINLLATHPTLHMQLLPHLPHY